MNNIPLELSEFSSLILQTKKTNKKRESKNIEDRIENLLINFNLMNSRIFKFDINLKNLKIDNYPVNSDDPNHSHFMYEEKINNLIVKMISIPNSQKNQYLEAVIVKNTNFPLHFNNGYHINFQGFWNSFRQFFSKHDNEFLATEKIGIVASMIAENFKKYLIKDEYELTEDMREKLSRYNLLNMAAQVHDIGKVTLDTNIINKPSRLTYEEMEKVYLHPKHGKLILNDIITSPIILDSIGLHHSRYDKKDQYPEKSEDRYFCIDILMATDILCAITSNKRNYLKKLDRSPELFFDRVNGKNGDEKGDYQGFFSPLFVNFLNAEKYNLLNNYKYISRFLN